MNNASLICANRFKNGTIIKSKSITYENNVAKYKISEALETTQGTYTCQAKNEAGSAETKCVVKVQGTPFLYLSHYKEER